jgi:hypothetical protein
MPRLTQSSFLLRQVTFGIVYNDDMQLAGISQLLVRLERVVKDGSLVIQVRGNDVPAQHKDDCCCS